MQHRFRSSCILVATVIVFGTLVFIAVLERYKLDGATLLAPEGGQVPEFDGHDDELPPRIHKHRVARDMLPIDPKIIRRFQALSGRKQDDPELISFIREEFIEDRRPFLPKLSHNVYKTPQADEVDKYFKAKNDGFFVEAGALDGERSSNTIWFEKRFGWTGFLVEMDPSYYLQLRGKNRRCYTCNACISPSNYSSVVPFQEKGRGNGAIVPKASLSTFPCLCFPFYSMMRALDKVKIDYFSLDVEGQELAILRTIPFDEIDISVLSVEYLHTDKQQLRDFMESQGYVTAKTLSYENRRIPQWSYDFIFVKEDLFRAVNRTQEQS
ncbi:hypothetical protein CAPTEDRAFT_209618 [Capitella teleta]|uniref:Methyltransferase FkbM domain-containing protein n=1 Tax=Capitella teleta TaxID=283909 RepID=R7TG84_CAPTE|nr:hypothetical protein CAPTEDRAFT_209618 [Capitella teleta]|eukprot:ELT90566.1 hypothetical protein CAPTEDRAFT_209618 [Capitella teleta]